MQCSLFTKVVLYLAPTEKGLLACGILTTATGSRQFATLVRRCVQYIVIGRNDSQAPVGDEMVIAIAVRLKPCLRIPDRRSDLNIGTCIGFDQYFLLGDGIE